jgi:hypothetical protein
MVALLVASILGNRRRKRRFSRLVAVVAGVAALGAIGLIAISAISDIWLEAAAHTGPRSPDGRWTLVGFSTDGGAMAPSQVDISVSHVVLGLVQEQREIYSGSSWGPRMRWVNSSTVMFDGHAVNIFKDRMYSASY